MFAFFKTFSEEQPLLLENDHENSNCQAGARRLAWTATVLGTLLTTASAFLYLFNKNINPSQKDHSKELLLTTGLVISGLGISALLINECKKKLEQILHERQIKNAPIRLNL